MKHSLGKVLFLFLLIVSTTSASAAAYTWEAHAKKSRLFMHQAVEVEYICHFEDEAYQYVIEFSPPKETDAYRMYRLSETERIVNGKRVNRYRFVLFFEKSGHERLMFDALMRRTSKESIENTVIGRDNVEDFSFTDTAVVLPVLTFDISAQEEALTGSFTLDVHLDKDSVNAYDSIPLTISVKGVGNFDRFSPFKLEIEDVDLFKEAPQKTLALTSEGFSGTWIERYALIPQHDFELPEFTLRYFDPVAKRVKVLKSALIKVSVTEDTVPEALLDSEEDEVPSQWSWSFVYYLLTLITGIIMGRYLHIKLPESEEDGTLYSQLLSCRDPKRFVTLLVLLNDPKFDGMIAELDQQIKLGGSVNLQKYKKAMEDERPVFKEKRAERFTKIEVMTLKVMDKLVKKDSKK